MKLTLTSREQRLLAAGGVLLLIVAWTYLKFIIGPLAREAGALGQDVAKAREELRMLQVVTANEDTLRRQHEQLDQSVAALQKLLPSEKEIPAVIELLSDLASQTDVKIQSIFPQRPEKGKEPVPPPAPQVFKDVVIQIDAAAGFHQLGTFLSLVESQSVPLQVASLKISSDPKFLRAQRVKLLIRSYFALAGSPTAAAGRPGG